MTQFFSSLFNVPPALQPLLQSIGTVWSNVWWIVLPLVTGMMAWEAWRLYQHVRFMRNLNFKLLEIKIPKNVLKTPKAMEQIFAAAHAPYSYGYYWWLVYWKGMEEFWMSFELVGRAGESHFYLRVPAAFRNMMEAAIYGQFPEAEIAEVADYLDDMPEVLPNKEYDIGGFEEVLRFENYRPIRTYPMFEDAVEERRVDTMATLLEAISKLRGNEQLWFQVIIRPAGEDFQKEGEKAISKLLGIEEEKKKNGGLFSGFGLGVSLGEILWAPFQHPSTEPAKKKEEDRFARLKFLVPPHDKERAEAIQKKISKIAFDSTLRFVYIEPRDTPVKPEHMNSIHGFIRQFNTQDLNSLRPYTPNVTFSSTVHGPFRKTRLHWRKRLIYERYLNTQPLSHISILNVEELATVFHFPTGTVTTSELEKVESRKGTPPAALPIVEE
jgi:hypothetical protein